MTIPPSGTDQNMFFWFFEARDKPKEAPVALWLNGGPGCSSMLGLFQGNGPCTFNGGGDDPKLNPNSWNNFANMVSSPNLGPTSITQFRARPSPWH